MQRIVLEHVSGIREIIGVIEGPTPLSLSPLPMISALLGGAPPPPTYALVRSHPRYLIYKDIASPPKDSQ